MLRSLATLLAGLLSAFQLQAASVTDFGAVGDGRVDDTEAIQKAIDHAGGNGGTLHIPPGRYLIGDDVTIDRAVSFQGSGHRESVITSNGGAARFLIRQSGASFRNLGFVKMIEPMALDSRDGYVLENLSFERCRFEDIVVRNANRGVIGLSSGNASQRPHRIRNLIIRECVFRNIDAHAINIRANISGAQVIDSLFLDIVNVPESESPFGGFAIRLGDSMEKGGGDAGASAEQGRHRIEGNVIRGLRKSTVEGNLIGILLYGDHSIVRGNFIEDIDGTAKGDDTNAIYIRGSHNRIVSNTIRKIRGSDDDGALCLKGGMALGNRHNVIAYNRIEKIRGMSAVEVSTSDLLFFENEIDDAPTRGFYQRVGRNVSITDNVFTKADAVLRTDEGEAVVSGNHFVESRLSLEQRSDHASSREAVYIYGNRFLRTSPNSATPVIRLANGVEEQWISIRNNSIRNLVLEPRTRSGRSLVDLVSNGNARNVEIVGNYVDQAGSETLLFRIGGAAGSGKFAGNTIVIRDIRGPVIDSAFATIEKNTIHILPEAAERISISRLFSMSGYEAGATLNFRDNRLLNHAPHLRIGELIHWKEGSGKIVFSHNLVEGNFEDVGNFPDSFITSTGNTLPAGLGR